MRTLIVVLNTIATLCFAAFLAYTFIARQHLDSLARRFVTEKTLRYSKPIVDAAEQSLATPLARKLLTDNQAAIIRHEVAEYRHNPSAYILDLTREPAPTRREQQPNPLLEKAAAVKAKIRQFYDDTLAALIEDLRIFSATNLCAAAISLGLAFHSRAQPSSSIMWFSFLMLLAVVYCSAVYVDDLTFFRILFRTHMSWRCPVLLCATIAAVYFDCCGHAISSVDQQPGSGINRV